MWGVHRKVELIFFPADMLRFKLVKPALESLDVLQRKGHGPNPVRIPNIRLGRTFESASTRGSALDHLDRRAIQSQHPYS